MKSFVLQILIDALHCQVMEKAGARTGKGIIDFANDFPFIHSVAIY